MISKALLNSKCPWGRFKEVGIFYSDITNATYQLNLKVPNDGGAYIGLGRLVNNRTSFTYLKTGDNDYQIYNRGQLVFKKECDDPYALESKLGFDKDETNFLTYCKDKVVGGMKYILLKDYGFAPIGQLMPAILIASPSDLNP